MCSQSDGQRSSHAAATAAVSMDSTVLSPTPLETAGPELAMTLEQSLSPGELVTGTPAAVGEPGHVVMLHILDGESIQFQHGDSIQLITGPATVPMVSSGMVPPVPYPVQVPPGHVMQQVVDSTGTLRHVILAPEPATHGTLGPSPHSPVPHPQALHPMAMPVVHPCDTSHVGADYTGLPCESSVQTAPEFVEPCVDPAYMSPPAMPPGASTGRYGNDERCRRQADRLRRKLNERRRNKSEHRQEYARNESAYMSAAVEQRPLASTAGGGGVTVDSLDSNSEPIAADQQPDTPSVLPPPRVDEVWARRAVISLLLPEDQLVQLLMLEAGSCRQQQQPSAIHIIESSCSQQLELHVTGGCVLLHELSQLKPATTYYTLFRVQDGDHVWLSDVTKFTTLEDVPDQPLSPILHHRTKTSLHLRWSMPADNGSRVTHFVLESDSGSGFVEVYRGRSRQYVLSHLAPGSSVLCRLTAINSVGASLPSTAAMFCTNQPAPPAPMGPSLQSGTQAVTPHSLSVVWQAVGPARPLSYTVQMERRGGQHGFRVVYSGSDTVCTVHSLQPSTEYVFRVRATDENNAASPWSDTGCFRTAGVPPAPPTRLHQRGRSHSHQLRVQWSAEEGCDLIGFVVQSRTAAFSGDGEDRAWQEQLCDAKQRECLLTQLPPGTAVQVRVLSVGEAGRSVPGTPLTVYTEPVRPGPCVSPRLIGRPRATSCLVTWLPPEYLGGEESVVAPSCEYRLSISDGRQMCRELSVARSIQPLEASVANLMPGQHYRVCVRAVNSAGAGPWSDPLLLVTAACPPDPPAAPCLSAPPSAHALSLIWPVCQADNGAPVTEYRVDVARGPGAPFSTLYSGPECQCEVSGLEAATAYILRVRAVNSAGCSVASDSLLVATTSTVPDRVGRPLVQLVQCDSIQVQWETPGSGGADISLYQVQLARCGHSRRSSITDTTETSIELNGLRPATTYSVRVRACNMMGAGVFSPPLRILTNSHIPSAPLLQLVQAGTSFVRVEWSMTTERESESDSESADGDELVCESVEPLTFTLECQSGGAGPYYSVYEGSEYRFRCDRLLASTAYRFRVYATNSAGDSSYSLPVSCTTAHQPAPPVKGLSVVQRRSNHVDVEWQPVRLPAALKHQLSNNNSNSSHHQQQLPRYQLQLAAANSTLFSQVYDDVSARYRVTSLSPATDYQLRVRCVLPRDSCSPDGGVDDRLCGPFSAPVRFTTQSAAAAVQPGGDRKGEASTARRNRHNTTPSSSTIRASMMRRFGESMERLWAMLLLFGFGVAAFIIAALVHYTGLVPSPGDL